MFYRAFFLLMTLGFLGACSSTNQGTPVEQPHYSAELQLEQRDANAAFNPLVNRIKPSWYKTAKRFMLEDSSSSKMYIHRFFDVNPRPNTEEQTLNVVVTTPVHSAYEYKMDLTTGQLYTEQKYCLQYDVNESFGGDIISPPFSIGIVPRVLDQLNDPQKILVFGSSDFYTADYKDYFFEVRVIGAYIENECSEGACLEMDQWRSRLVLLGVQKGDPNFDEVMTLEQLKEKVNWTLVKAFIENGQGKNILSETFYPTFRVGSMIEADVALDFMKKNSYLFTVEKINQMRGSCYKLYDHLWKSLGFKGISEKTPKTIEEIKLKAKLLSMMRRGKKISVKPFHKRLTTDLIKFAGEFKTCSKYIYPANINDGQRRHLLFTFLRAYSLMTELGYFYDCAGKKWEKNPFVVEGQRLYDPAKKLLGCSDKNIDLMMEKTIEMFHLFKKSQLMSYRYITYDGSAVGTHHKLFSWVPFSPRGLACVDVKEAEFKSQQKIFPDDFKWEKREIEKENQGDLGEIIY